jgi:hypothetical protein
MKLKNFNKSNLVLSIAFAQAVPMINSDPYIPPPFHIVLIYAFLNGLPGIVLVYLIIVLLASFIWKGKHKEKYLHFFKSKLFIWLTLIYFLMFILFIYSLYYLIG